MDTMARYQKAFEAIALSVNTNLTILLTEAKEHENHFNDLRQAASGAAEFYGQEAGAAFHEFHNQVEAVVAGVRSLVAMTNLVFSKYAEPEDFPEVSHNLEEALKRLSLTEA